MGVWGTEQSWEWSDYRGVIEKEHEGWVGCATNGYWWFYHYSPSLLGCYITDAPVRATHTNVVTSSTPSVSFRLARIEIRGCDTFFSTVQQSLVSSSCRKWPIIVAVECEKLEARIRKMYGPI